jgi:hypothetical protein
MPSHHGGRRHDDQRIAPAAPPARQQHPETAVQVAEPWSLDQTLEHAELAAQAQVDFNDSARVGLFNRGRLRTQHARLQRRALSYQRGEPVSSSKATL